MIDGQTESCVRMTIIQYVGVALLRFRVMVYPITPLSCVFNTGILGVLRVAEHRRGGHMSSCL